MFRTDKSVGMLQAIATIAILAILLWSLGLPSLRFADAANLTTVSDVLSDSAPSASSTHTITFTSPTGILNGEYATVTMQAGISGIAALTASDVTLATTSAATIAASCGATDIAFTTSGQNLIFEFCAAGNASLDAGGTTTITIGVGAATDLTNPGTEGSYDVTIAAGSVDTGGTKIAIIDSVFVTASVDTIFSFAVSGLPGGTSMNGDTTTGTTSTTSIPFGKLTAGAPTTTAQRLTVSTNASNGYVVTVQTDGDLQSSTGATIDPFDDGVAVDLPAVWSAPAGTVGSPETYGHWGITSDDPTTTRTNEFPSQQYIGATTTARVVMSHDGPVNGTNAGGLGTGTSTVGYKIEISALQEAGDDYTAYITYIATPTF